MAAGLEVRQAKSALRREMMELRLKAAEARPRAAHDLHEHFFRSFRRLAGVVAIYHAFGSELSISPVADSLAASGHLLALPVITGKGRPLDFRLYRPGDELAANRLGIPEPLATAPLVKPRVMLVPLLAFDLEGRRLGYGGGYYDRSLHQLRAAGPLIAIGIGYGCQQVEAVPAEPFDQRLDLVLTEYGPVELRIEGRSG